MKLCKLFSEQGRWALNDNSQVYKYVVYLCDEDDIKKWHLIDENGNEIFRPSPKDVIVEKLRGDF